VESERMFMVGTGVKRYFWLHTVYARTG